MIDTLTPAAKKASPNVRFLKILIHLFDRLTNPQPARELSARLKHRETR
jgi:hypothetical protein